MNKRFFSLHLAIYIFRKKIIKSRKFIGKCDNFFAFKLEKRTNNKIITFTNSVEIF